MSVLKIQHFKLKRKSLVSIIESAVYISADKIKILFKRTERAIPKPKVRTCRWSLHNTKYSEVSKGPVTDRHHMHIRPALPQHILEIFPKCLPILYSGHEICMPFHSLTHSLTRSLARTHARTHGHTMVLKVKHWQQLTYFTLIREGKWLIGWDSRK